MPPDHVRRTHGQLVQNLTQALLVLRTLQVVRHLALEDDLDRRQCTNLQLLDELLVILDVDPDEGRSCRLYSVASFCRTGASC
ncbi:MAG: hypothetical protein U5O39_20660 [Gammaproteobacteria bacterium]|nr:hypothetical protein [Gammaproteobacteria bacterium]